MARVALLPRVKASLRKDSDSGFILEIEAKELEIIAESSIDPLVSEGKISGRDVYIDPAQDLSNDTPLKAKAEVVFNDILHAVDFDLGLTNKLQ